MLNLKFTEFWYLGRPKELAEYRRLKSVASDNKRAKEVLSELNQHKKKKRKKRGRKRRKRYPRNPRGRLKKR